MPPKMMSAQATDLKLSMGPANWRRQSGAVAKCAAASFYIAKVWCNTCCWGTVTGSPPYDKGVFFGDDRRACPRALLPVRPSPIRGVKSAARYGYPDNQDVVFTPYQDDLFPSHRGTHDFRNTPFRS
jgi:hypothetical protein